MNDLWEFWNKQGEWSQEVFGRDSERGPMGPLLHLQKEVNEAIVELTLNNKEGLHEEIVDCLFLVIDSARRAGLTHDRLMALAFAKLEKNKKRKWAKPTSDKPVEHIRGEND